VANRETPLLVPELSVGKRDACNWDRGLTFLAISLVLLNSLMVCRLMGDKCLPYGAPSEKPFILYNLIPTLTKLITCLYRNILSVSVACPRRSFRHNIPSIYE
jgi:hypothetical protein